MIYLSDDLIANTSDLDLTYSRIGYSKYSGTVTAQNAAGGFPASAADNSLTYSYWKPSGSSSYWQIMFDEDQTIDYVGIAAHDIGTNGGTVNIQISVGGSWSSVVDPITPSDDSAIMAIFEATECEGVRISTMGIFRIGVVYAGESLTMQRAIFGSHSPISLSKSTTYTNNKSVTGQWLGRSIQSQGLVTEYSWSNIELDWYNDNFKAFAESAVTMPFFIAWRPKDYQNDVGYCWTSNDIVPQASGTRNMVSVSVAVEGI